MSQLPVTDVFLKKTEIFINKRSKFLLIKTGTKTNLHWRWHQNETVKLCRKKLIMQKLVMTKKVMRT